jgi:DNA-binding GntR family transcriptional regulator
LERLRRVDGKTTLYVVNQLPVEYASVLPEVLKNKGASLYATLATHCGVELTGSSRVLEAVPAGRALARQLDVAPRFPLIFIESVNWDSTGKPIDCYRAWLRTDRLRIAMRTQQTAVSGAMFVVD